MSYRPGIHTLRPARPTDVPEMARIEVACFPDRPYSAQLIQRFIELGFPCVVAETAEGGRIDGFAMAMTEEGDGAGNLVTLDVVPGARRRGLGTSMVRWCARALMEAEPPADVMWLTVASRNEGARAFYGHLGFRSVDVIDRYYPDDDAIVMVHLDLQALAGDEG